MKVEHTIVIKSATLEEHNFMAKQIAIAQEAYKNSKRPNIVNQPLENLELRQHVVDRLRGENILSVMQLIARSEQELCQIKRFGRTTVNEIKDALKKHGLKLTNEFKLT